MSKKPIDRGVCFCCRKTLTSDTVGEDKFTKEHYIPQWPFSRHGLRQQTMDLPSKSEIAYGLLWVPCCAGCNNRLNTEVEERARVLITSVPPPWTEADRDIIKRWLAKVYLGVRVRASTLPVDQKNPASLTIADQQEIDEADLLRMVVDGSVKNPHSSLFVYECKRGDDIGFDIWASDIASIVMVRSGSVGLVCLLLDGQEIERNILPAHPLLVAATAGPLSAPSFRMLSAYALAAAAAANVCHDVLHATNTTGQRKPIWVKFTPHWTDGPTWADIQVVAEALADQFGVDVQWTEPPGRE